ncbi:MAG TPA: DUF423 domain-containing protein [Chitinophagaceae bacterium]|jgi:uncharacterized membrane protein YgdD (TMEM256/DUF423 family)
MHKAFLSLGAFFGTIAVALGAFGAHGLKKIVAPDSINVFQTGVQYQMYHTLALLIIAIVYDRLPNKWIKYAGNFFCFGILFFSGSLYVITAFAAWGKAVPTSIGVLTPVGGAFFICGWICFFVGVGRKNSL